MIKQTLQKCELNSFGARIIFTRDTYNSNQESEQVSHCVFL